MVHVGEGTRFFAKRISVRIFVRPHFRMMITITERRCTRNWDVRGHIASQRGGSCSALLTEPLHKFSHYTVHADYRADSARSRTVQNLRPLPLIASFEIIYPSVCHSNASQRLATIGSSSAGPLWLPFSWLPATVRRSLYAADDNRHVGKATGLRISIVS